MSSSDYHYDLDHCSEDHIPLSPLALGIAAVGLVCILVVEFSALPIEFGVFGLLMMGAAATVWALGKWRTLLGRWMALLLPAFAIVELSLSLSEPVILCLASLVVSLATTLSGPVEGIGLAISFTALVALAPHSFGFARIQQFAFVLLTWTSFAVVYCISRRQKTVRKWLQEYFTTHRTLLAEARDRKAELEQNRNDWIHASRQLALANERLAGLKASAEQAHRDKADFVARVSHEFRTPLNIIIGMVDLMVESQEPSFSDLPSKVKQRLEIVHRNCQHLASMIDDVLDLSQSEAGKMALRRSQADIVEIVQTSMEVVRPLADEKGLTLSFSECDSVVPLVYCDAVRIRQVILNLLSNATRYTDVGGVTVSLKAESGGVRVAVSDTGPGIPRDEVERIFEPFGRGDRPLSEGQGGSGLGLAISLELVRAHGGRMWLETEQDKGSTFCIELPINPIVALEPSVGSQISEEWIWQQRATWADVSRVVSRKRMVILGGNDSVRAALANYDDLAELVYADDLAEAAPLLASPTDLVLVILRNADDVPGQLHAVRQIAGETPVFLGVLPSRPDMLQTQGISGYLTKPVTRKELADAVKLSAGDVHCVLIADDDRDTRELFRSYLTAGRTGIEVREADSGLKAIEIIKENKPDVALLDVVLPDQTGWDVVAAARRDGLLEGVAVLMVSGKDAPTSPLRSEYLMATVAGGLSLGKTLASAAILSTLLLGDN